MIKTNFIVEKRNVLNEIRSNNMTLQELRFFSIYLAKINARDISTRCVRFPLSDFQKIMELDRLKIDYLKTVTNSLLSKVVNIPLEKKGNYIAFQLFKECVVAQDDDDVWYVEIDAHDKALPLMFEFKEKYFSYQLWNALRLKSSNQLRMYEILKQYEKIGERIISVDELKELLGIAEDEHQRYNNFKTQVIEVCKDALEENTDIKFTYEPHGKKGRGGKILELKFLIYKNNDYKDKISLEDFISNNEADNNFINKDIFDYEEIESEEMEEFENKYLEFYSDACENEFNELEIQVLVNLLIQLIPHIHGDETELKRYNLLKNKYDYMKLQSQKRDIKNKFGYIRKLIEFELDVE